MAWNGSDSVGKRDEAVKASVTSSCGGASSKKSSLRHGIVAGVAVVVGGLAAWMYFGTSGPSKPARAKDGLKPARIADVKPPSVAKPVTNAPVKAVEKKPEVPEIPPGMVAVTNAGKVIFMTEKEAETFRRATRRTTIRTATEKRLRLLASIPPGMPVPPMPGGLDMDKDLQETLNNKIEILPDDTEREIEQKKFVMAFKEYMIEEIAGGKTANQVYDEYVNTMNKVAELTTQGSKMAREMKNGGDLDGAREFLKKVNAKIEALGGTPIDIDRRGPKGRIQDNVKEDK